MSDSKRIGMFFDRRIKIRTLLTITLLLAYPALTKAADDYWNAASGNWSDTNPSPWSLSTEPTSSVNAYIQNGGTATITQSGEVSSYLYLGAANTGAVQMTGGSLSVGNYEYIGNSGIGTFTQSGGTNAITINLYLGYNSGATGTYNLSDTGYLSASNWEVIGYSGTGTFNQTGGTNTAPILLVPLSWLQYRFQRHI